MPENGNKATTSSTTEGDNGVAAQSQLVATSTAAQVDPNEDLTTAAEAAGVGISALSDNGLVAQSTGYTPDSENFHVNVTNLTLSSVKLWPTDKSTLSYHWNVGFNTAAGSFQEGDTVSIPSDLSSYFTFDTGWSTDVSTPEGVVVATMTMDASGTLKLTFNSSVTGMNLTNLEGNYDTTNHGTLKAKDLNLSVDTLETVTVADATASETFYGGNRLYIAYSGSGTFTINDIDGGTFISNDSWYGKYYQYTTTATGDILVSSNPAAAATLTSVTFTDGSGNVTTLTPDANGQVTLPAASLTHWDNTLRFNYTFLPGAMDTNKTSWKVQWSTSADNKGLFTQRQFDSYYNPQALIGLYQNDGTSLAHNGSANNDENNVLYEDELPGGSTGTWKTPSITAGVMYAMTITDPEGNTVYTPTDMQSGGYNFSYTSADLVANGVLDELTPATGETIETFRARVKADSLSWGIYTDAGGNSHLMVNLGSPSDATATSDEAVKIQDTSIWSSISSDATLSKINGPTNCVGGNAQMFRISVIGDYEGNVYDQTLSNTATATTAAGTVTNMGPANYIVPGDTVLSLPSSGWLNIVKRDAISGNTIEGASFNIKKWNEDTSVWEDYVSTDVPKVTDSGGLAHMGAMVAGKYRVYETSAPADYDISTIAVQSTGGTAFDSSALPETDPDYGTAGYLGQFSVTAGDASGCAVVATNHKTFDVTYDGNTNTSGSAPANTTSYVDNSIVTVLGNTGATTDPDAPYVKDGYTFTGWNTKADGSGTSYAAGKTFTLTADTTLYAQWRVSSITVDSTASGAEFLQKTASGTGFPAKQFDFTITPSTSTVDAITGTSPAPVDATGATVTTGKASFSAAGTKTIDLGKVTFTDPGTYTYKVQETTANTYGWTNDTAEKTVTVMVSLESDNTLKATVTGATVTNSYAVVPAYVKTSTDTILTKTVTGTGFGTKSFDFSIAPGTATYTDETGGTGTSPAPIATSGAVLTSGTAEFTDDGTGTMSQSVGFGTIELTRPGTYVYAITETTASGSGWTCDTTPQTVTITATDAGGGKLNVSVAKATIANSYKVASATVDTSADATAFVTKTVTGEGFTARDFNFTLTQAASDTTKATVAKTNGTANFTAAASKTVGFGNVTFTKADTYHFTAVETDAAASGWTLDNAAAGKEITVTVTDNHLGQLVAKITKATFTNTYKAPGSSDIQVTKSVDKTEAVADDTLTYTIHVANDGTRASEGVYVTDYIPANTTYVGNDNRGKFGATTEGKGYVTWFIDSLKAGASVDLTMTVKVNSCQSGTAIDNVALWQETPTKPDSPEAEGKGAVSNKVTTTVGTTVAPTAAAPTTDNTTTATTTTTDNNKTSSLAKTGDAVQYGIVIALMAAAGAAMIISRRRCRGL